MSSELMRPCATIAGLGTRSLAWSPRGEAGACASGVRRQPWSSAARAHEGCRPLGAHTETEPKLTASSSSGVYELAATCHAVRPIAGEREGGRTIRVYAAVA
jgi:hypothetical protein